jgi:hypothetical protein
MSQSHLRQKQCGMEQNKDLNVATPEEFVRQFGGNRVINRVSTLPHLSHGVSLLIKP